VDRPEGGERIDIEAFVQDGGTVQISFDPGQSGSVDENGDVSQKEAMLQLHRPPAPDPSAYSTEPPFY
jgi:hypothetical protein